MSTRYYHQCPPHDRNLPGSCYSNSKAGVASNQTPPPSPPSSHNVFYFCMSAKQEGSPGIYTFDHVLDVLSISGQLKTHVRLYSVTTQLCRGFDPLIFRCTHLCIYHCVLLNNYVRVHNMHTWICVMPGYGYVYVYL